MTANFKQADRAINWNRVPAEACQFNPGVRTALSLDSENFDFFSGSGSSYIIGKSEETDDEDWDF